MGAVCHHQGAPANPISQMNDRSVDKSSYVTLSIFQLSEYWRYELKNADINALSSSLVADIHVKLWQLEKSNPP